MITEDQLDELAVVLAERLNALVVNLDEESYQGWMYRRWRAPRWEREPQEDQE